MSYVTPLQWATGTLQTPTMSYATSLQWATSHTSNELLYSTNPGNELCHTLNELRHTPNNELLVPRHKPQQSATPHPSNELRHISRMSFATSLQWANKNPNIELSVADPDLGSAIGFFRIPDPKSIFFWELSDNFLGKKFYNSLKIGPNFFLQHFKTKIIINFVKFVLHKKLWQQIFFHPSLLLLFLDPGSGMGKNQDPGSGINIPDPQHWLSYAEPPPMSCSTRD